MSTVRPAEEVLDDATRGLRRISLEDVVATAALQTRRDRKYVVPLGLLATVLERMGDGLSVLEIEDRRVFRYESVYFDTPDLTAYHQHAHDRRRRVKVRTRTYLDSGECLLEFKRVGARGETVKERYPYRLADRDALDEAARRLALDRVGASIRTAALAKVLTTTYQRATLVDPTQGHRVTCDVNLAFADGNGRAFGPLGGVAVVESKTVGSESPVDRVLRSLGSRPLSLSKYCVGMAVLDPGLPANRWNRELRVHFGWTPWRDDEPPVPLVRAPAHRGPQLWSRLAPVRVRAWRALPQ
ncbi:MAG: polyphosphate polymerase domain-containing protein [Nocardioides sp.]